MKLIDAYFEGWTESFGDSGISRFVGWALLPLFVVLIVILIPIAIGLFFWEDRYYQAHLLLFLLGIAFVAAGIICCIKCHQWGYLALIGLGLACMLSWKIEGMVMDIGDRISKTGWYRGIKKFSEQYPGATVLLKFLLAASIILGDIWFLAAYSERVHDSLIMLALNTLAFFSALMSVIWVVTKLSDDDEEECFDG